MTAKINHLAVPDHGLAVAKTDGDFLHIAKAIKEYGIADLERKQGITELIAVREKTAAIEEFMARLVRDRDLQLQAQNDIAELRLRQERRIGQMLQSAEKKRRGQAIKNR